jgi:hypothetical protein
MEIRDVKDRDGVFHGPLFEASIMEALPERADLLPSVSTGNVLPPGIRARHRSGAMGTEGS